MFYVEQRLSLLGCSTCSVCDIFRTLGDKLQSHERCDLIGYSEFRVSGSSRITTAIIISR